MLVDFWFDPACPFCWMTSRWINEVAPRADLQIRWRSISLLMKNNVTPENPRFARVRSTHRMLRVVEAVRAAGHEDSIGALYTELGRHVHHLDDADVPLERVLGDVGLDPALAAAAGDERWDGAIRASMNEGLDLTGPDVGTPLIAIDGPNGRVGFFGPVITELPDPDAGLRLWNGFVAMVTTPGFYELKRTRTGPPARPPEDRIGSTAARAGTASP